MPGTLEETKAMHEREAHQYDEEMEDEDYDDEDYDEEEEEEEFGYMQPLGPRPEYRPENIHLVVDTVDRYNPEHVPALQEYVNAQLSSKTYDRAANLALLKLYQFNPVYTNLEYVSKILLKALTVLPEPDFNLCLCLLSEDITTPSTESTDAYANTIPELIELQQLLESANFAEFWKRVAPSSTSTPSSPKKSASASTKTISKELQTVMKQCVEFDNLIRTFILTTVSTTFQTVPLSALTTMLNFPNATKTMEYLKTSHPNWTVNQANDTVDIPVLKDLLGDVVSSLTNKSKPTAVVRESLKFEQLTKILGYSNQA